MVFETIASTGSANPAVLTSARFVKRDDKSTAFFGHWSSVIDAIWPFASSTVGFSQRY
jgi:hypothetical protein